LAKGNIGWHFLEILDDGIVFGYICCHLDRGKFGCI
jgi:hypothetical protein